MWAWLKKWLNPYNWFKSDPADAVAAVIKTTETLCGFVPTVASVAAMLSAANPTVVGVGAVAQAICAVMSPRKMQALMTRADVPPPYVNGILVEGEWKQ